MTSQRERHTYTKRETERGRAANKEEQPFSGSNRDINNATVSTIKIPIMRKSLWIEKFQLKLQHAHRIVEKSVLNFLPGINCSGCPGLLWGKALSSAE